MEILGDVRYMIEFIFEYELFLGLCKIIGELQRGFGGVVLENESRDLYDYQ